MLSRYTSFVTLNLVVSSFFFPIYFLTRLQKQGERSLVRLSWYQKSTCIKTNSLSGGQKPRKVIEPIVNFI